MDKPYTERIGGSYLRDKDTGALTRVEGPSEPARAEGAGDGKPAGSPSVGQSDPVASDDQPSQDKPSRKGK